MDAFSSGFIEFLGGYFVTNVIGSDTNRNQDKSLIWQSKSNAIFHKLSTINCTYTRKWKLQRKVYVIHQIFHCKPLKQFINLIASLRDGNAAATWFIGFIVNNYSTELIRFQPLIWFILIIVIESFEEKKVLWQLIQGPIQGFRKEATNPNEEGCQPIIWDIVFPKTA